jgi:hypothetical protein
MHKVKLEERGMLILKLQLKKSEGELKCKGGEEVEREKKRGNVDIVPIFNVKGRRG